MPRHLADLTATLAVCDTNTMISAALLPGSIPAQTVARLQRMGPMLFSAETLQELENVLFRAKFDKRLTFDNRLRFFRTITSQANILEPATHITACRDPKDDKFLSLALAAHASHLITGDADLLALHPFRGTTILTPRDFLAL